MLGLEPFVADGLNRVAGFVYTQEDPEEELETIKILMGAIEGITGIEPEAEFSLEECGLASIGVPALVKILNKIFSRGKDSGNVTISSSDLVMAETVQEMADLIDAAKDLAQHQGV